MKSKTRNILMWFLSVLFLLSTITLISQTWTAILLIIPTLLLNPKLSNLLKSKYNFNSKWWIKLCVAIIPLIIVSSNLPTNTITTSTPIQNTNSNMTSSNLQSSNSIQNSKVEIPNSKPNSNSSTISSSLNTNSVSQSSEKAKLYSTINSQPITLTPSVSSNKNSISSSTNTQDTTVYITDKGHKYHTEYCRTLKKSKHAISLKDAKAKGYTACEVCDPPE